MNARSLVILPVLASLACAPGVGPSSSKEPEGPACHEQPDYLCDVQPLVEKHCLSCHARGGIGPFALETYEELTAMATPVLDAVEAKRMPPWPPEESEDCPTFQGSRALKAAEIETLRAWVEGGMEYGVEGSKPAPSEVEQAVELEPLGVPDHTLSVGPGYTPNANLPDDYRCFIMDLGLTEDAYMHAYEVLPGNQAIVHHVIMYVVLERDVERLERWEDRDPELGYECFGAPAPGIPMTLGGWVPGQRPQRFRRGDGAWIPAGSKLVVQMHYNLLATQGTDETRINLHYIDGEPFREIGTLPYPAMDFIIPPGDAEYTYTESTGPLPDILFSADLDLRMEGVAPHMHMLGTKLSFSAELPDGGEQCLVRINDWDFNWQGFYLFDGEEPLPVNPGSGFKLSCTWDNSEDNQPFINGVRQVPQSVEWGEGTTDEMCLAYLIVSGKPGWTQTLLDFIDAQ